MSRDLEPLVVDTRVKISALWASMLFVFAYVDLFSLYRSDFRAEVESGVIAGFTIGQGFLLGVTVYIVVPSLMVAGSVLVRPAVARLTNLVLPVAYSLTIIGGAIGEWGYYVLGSAVEVALLAGIAYLAWTWPTVGVGGPSSAELATAAN